MGMHQVGYDRPLAPHLNSQFILKAGPEYWGRALIRMVRYSTSPGSARPGGRILRLGAPGSLWSGGAAQLAEVHNCDTGPGRPSLVRCGQIGFSQTTSRENTLGVVSRL